MGGCHHDHDHTTPSIDQYMPFASLNFLASIKPTSDLSQATSFDRLSLDNGRTGTARSVLSQAHPLSQITVDAFPDSLVSPPLEVGVDGLPKLENPPAAFSKYTQNTAGKKSRLTQQASPLYGGDLLVTIR